MAAQKLCNLVAVCSGLILYTLYTCNSCTPQLTDKHGCFVCNVCVKDLVQVKPPFFPSLQAYQRPQLLGNDFGRLEFQQRPRKKHVGQQLLYRDRHMTGWYVRFIHCTVPHSFITVVVLAFCQIQCTGKETEL